MSPRVVLVGLPGAGKSTSGRRLAKILCLDFADTDELVEAATGRTVTAIFAESGEAAFRAAESAAIIDAFAGGFDGVLSLGGGAVTHEPTRAAVANSGVPVVMLHAPLETLLVRVGDGHTRPLLGGDPAARLAALATQRRPIYDALATLSVDTEHRTPGQVAAHVAARLHDMQVC
ncbi:MAG TPA: shikimate kinase [Jatrophihabitantaceae bacterium]|jgi:shikimate kinase|nr:shikimate kinase [Jatrophihabitantaceae bacterium]